MKRAVAPIALLALFVFIIIGGNTPAHAQFPLSNTADLSLNVSPNYPRPNSVVRLSVKSVLIDLVASNITWYANEAVIAGGVGVSEATITTGPLGTETRIRVEVLEQDLRASATGVFRPTEIDLLWEADSYVPPFYRGRALPSAGSNVRLFVVPRFKKIGATSFVPADELIYTWKKNGKLIQNASGRGKHSVTIEDTGLFGSDTISVDVRTTDSVLQGSSSVRLPSVEPSLVLYENHPVFGILYHRALQSPASVPEVETTFSVVPYFAPVQDPDDGSLVYKWRVGNSAIASNRLRPSAITINAEGTDGLAFIQLTLTHVSNFFMNARDSWNVTLAGSDPSSASSPFTDPFTNGE